MDVGIGAKAARTRSSMPKDARSTRKKQTRVKLLSERWQDKRAEVTLMLTRRHLGSIVGRALPELAGFRLHRGNLLSTPVGSVLQGINIDPSWLDPTGFNLEVFVIPLYVPNEDVSLMFVKRLHDPQALWQRDTPNLDARIMQQVRSVALPFLEARATPAAFVQAESRSESTNTHVPHAIASSLAKTGEYDRAVALIDGFLPIIDVVYDWQKRIVDECTAFRALMLRDRAAAQQQLLAWEQHTVAQLGLGRFR